MLCPQASDPAAREMLFIRQPSEHLAIWEGAKLTKERGPGDLRHQAGPLALRPAGGPRGP